MKEMLFDPSRLTSLRNDVLFMRLKTSKNWCLCNVNLRRLVSFRLLCYPLFSQDLVETWCLLLNLSFKCLVSHVLLEMLECASILHFSKIAHLLI